ASLAAAALRNLEFAFISSSIVQLLTSGDLDDSRGAEKGVSELGSGAILCQLQIYVKCRIYFT
ncbi:MAG: hypothetical protein LC775_06585, partial [Acidobacteria bacterium]|nr:hypothetical protein [Acidobacteriota bacterium]